MDSDGEDKRDLGSFKLLIPSATAWHPDNEHVLYIGGEDDPENQEKTFDGIYSVSIRSYERKLIYHDPEIQEGMAVSPDGKHLTLTSGSDESPQLYIVDYDGKNRRLLVKSNGGIYQPSFAPDGQEIIYTFSVRGEGKYRQSIMAVSIEGGEPREIYASEDPDERFDTAPASWLPDGRFVFDILDRENIKDRVQYAVSMDGKSEPVRISKNFGGGRTISPDGTKAVFNVGKSVKKTWLMTDFLPNNELAMK